LPEFDINYEATFVKTLEEKKPYKKDGKEETLSYNPGFTLTYTTIRNPYGKIVKVGFPGIMLMVFLLCTFQLPV